MESVTIEVTAPGDQAILVGEDELWVTVTGTDPLPDYTTIRRLAAQRGHDLPYRPLRYFPSWGGPGEPYEELWVVKKDWAA